MAAGEEVQHHRPVMDNFQRRESELSTDEPDQ